MERRDFLSALPSLAWLWAGKPPLPTPPEPPRKTLLQTCAVAGFQFYEGPNTWKEIAPGDRIGLVREPSNPYDPRAVAVYWKNRKLGFLPREKNGLAASLLDQGKTVYATVTARGDVREPWHCLELAVWMEE